MPQQKLNLSKTDFQAISAFIVKKYTFDEMVYKAAVSNEDRTMMAQRLHETNLLFDKLSKHPTYLTDASAKWLVSFLMEAQTHYRGFIAISVSMGDPDTKEIEEQLSKAEAIHEKVNEFLIECIED